MCAWVMRLWVLLWLCVVGGAWGAWRQGQRSHTLSLLPRNSTMRLCRDFSDPARFQRILAPINVERIVATEGHRRVGEFIKSEMDSLGWHTEWDAFEDNTPYGRKPFRNLIATQDPHAPRRLVLACHYDSKIFPGQVFLGSTDSAVPCAMMIDIAHTLTPYMYGRAAQNVSLQLVFFDGEEAYVNWSETDSTYGSRHLAAKWEKQWYPTQSQYNPLELSRELDRIDVLMLLDLIGAANPMFHNAANLGATKLFTELPRIEQSLRSIGCLSRQQRNVFGERVMQVGVEDDHIPFMKRGVPILHLISVPFPTVWHKLSDDTSALHFPTIHYVESIVRVFVAKYLGIAPL